MKKEELLYERSFNVEFYEGLCIRILRSHSFHSMRERTHENRGSSQEIESNQVFQTHIFNCFSIQQNSNFL